MKKIALFVAVCCALSACKKDETAKTAAVKNGKNQITQSAPKDTMPQAYRDLINGKIKQAFSFNFDSGEDNPNDELDNLRIYIARGYKNEIYFTLKDLDNNGIDELIIGLKDTIEKDSGKILNFYKIFNIYTISIFVNVFIF